MEQIKDRKIPYQLIAIFILVSAFIVVAGYIYYNGQKEHIKKEKQEDLAAIADLKTEQIVKMMLFDLKFKILNLQGEIRWVLH